MQGYKGIDKYGTVFTGTAQQGSSITTEALNVYSNGTYNAPSGKAYTPIIVQVPTGESSELPPVSEWSGTTFYVDKPYYIDDTYTIPSGYQLIINGEQTLIIKRTSPSIYGALVNNGTITNNGTIYVASGGCSITNRATITNNQEILVAYESSLSNYSGARLNNNGFINLLQDSILDNSGTFTPSQNSKVNSYDAIVTGVVQNEWGKEVLLYVDEDNTTYTAQRGEAFNPVIVSVGSQGSNELPPTSSWSGTTFTTDKDYVVSDRYDLPTGYTLNVSLGTVLIVKGGNLFLTAGTINNSGRIINFGEFRTYGSLINNGGIYTLIDSTFYDDGSFSGNKVESVGSDIAMLQSRYNEWTIGGGTLDEADLYVGQNAPSGAEEGDYWIDTSDQSTLLSDVLAYTATTTTMTATGIYVTIPKSGTYTFKFSAARTGTSGTYTTQLYKGSVGSMSAVSGAEITWTTNGRQGTCTVNVSCNQGDRVEIYSRTNSQSSYNATYTIVGQLVAYMN